MAGYGFVWLPPPCRADTSDQSVGYDVYDRFDLGRPGRPTLYGTETGLRNLASMLHRAGIDLHVDFVMNHNGYSQLNTPGFVAAGGYPGLAITLPNDIDGDFHSAFAGGDQYERLAGLIDIAHEKNHQFIRSPVDPNDNRNIRPGKTPAFGRLANVPDPANRRFYPDQGHNTIFVFDPKTGAGQHPGPRVQPGEPAGRRRRGRERDRLPDAQRAMADPGDRRRRSAHRRREARAGLRARFHRPCRLPPESAQAARRQPEGRVHLQRGLRRESCGAAAARAQGHQPRRSRPRRGQSRHARFQALFRAQGKPRDHRDRERVADDQERRARPCRRRSAQRLGRGVFRAVARRVQAVRAGERGAGLHADDAGQHRRLLQRQGVRRARLPEARPQRCAQRAQGQPAHAPGRGAQHARTRQLRRTLGRHRRAVRLRARVVGDRALVEPW